MAKSSKGGKAGVRSIGGKPSKSSAGGRASVGGDFKPIRVASFKKVTTGTGPLPRNGVVIIETRDGKITKSDVISPQRPRSAPVHVTISKQGEKFLVTEVVPTSAKPKLAPSRGLSSTYTEVGAKRPIVVEELATVETPRTIRRALYQMARKAFPSDAALAEAIGVHRSQITRWKDGEAASPENAWILRDLAFAVETLSEHLEGTTIHSWLYGSSPELEGEPPIESIRGGRLPDVLMAYQAQVSGAYD